jgi:hypothetical protein
VLAHLLSVQAFVVFESPEEAQRACQKDRETFGDKFGDRYVRVYPTLESDVPDMQLAFQQQHMMQQVGSRAGQATILNDRPLGSAVWAAL